MQARRTSSPPSSFFLFSFCPALLLCVALLLQLQLPLCCAQCTGSSMTFGPAASFVPQGATYADQLLGSSRALPSTQQVTALRQSFAWVPQGSNPVSVTVTLALYGPRGCDGQGDSQLLATTMPTVYAPGSLSHAVSVTLTANLPTPIILPAGTYTVLLSSDAGAQNVGVEYQSVTGALLLADAYPPAQAAAFALATFLTVFATGRETNAALIATSCTAGTATTLFPACTARPFVVYPTGADTNVPCASSKRVNTNTYTYNAALPYVTQHDPFVQTIFLSPIVVTQSQTLYSVSFLVLPETSATTRTSYTVRASLYIMSGTNSFALMAQSDQATLQASTLHGQFTEVYLQLQQPVYVAAGTTVYMDIVVDQDGLYSLVSTSATFPSYYNSGYDFTSARTSPASLTTTNSSPLDQSKGVLGCLGDIYPSSSVSSSARSSSGRSSSARLSSALSSSARSSSAVSSSLVSSSLVSSSAVSSSAVSSSLRSSSAVSSSAVSSSLRSSSVVSSSALSSSAASSSTASSSPMSSSVVSSSAVSSSAADSSSSSSSSSTGPASVVSDPRFVGFWGQSFFVTGSVGGVYNLLSDAAVQVNGYIVQLQSVSCPVIDGRAMERCFDEQGTYFGVLAIQVQGGDFIRITGGGSAHGFHSVQVNDVRQLQVGEQYDGRVVRHQAGAASASPSHVSLSVHRTTTHRLLVKAGLYAFTIDSVDRYVDVTAMDIADWDALVNTAQPDGLLGRTWNATVQVDDSEQHVEEFRLQGDDILGCSHQHDRFCQAQTVVKATAL